jgi:hypothetical protein
MTQVEHATPWENLCRTTLFTYKSAKKKIMNLNVQLFANKDRLAYYSWSDNILFTTVTAKPLI